MLPSWAISITLRAQVPGGSLIPAVPFSERGQRSSPQPEREI